MSSIEQSRISHWSLLAHYLRPYRLRLILLTITLFAAIGVQVTVPIVTARFINEIMSDSAFRPLVILALLTVALALVGQGLAVVETWLAEALGWDATNALRFDLVRHLLRLDPAFHASHSQGDLIERVDGDVAALSRFFSRFVIVIVGNGLLITTVIGLLFVIDWRIGAGVALFVIAALVIMLTIRRRGGPVWERERQTSAEVYGFLGEYIAGREDIRANGGRSFVYQQFTVLLRKWQITMRQSWMMGYRIFASSEGLFGLALAFAFASCAMLYHDNTLTLGTVYLVIRYTEMLRRPTEQIRNEIQDLQQADAAISRIASLLAEQPTLRDGVITSLPAGPLSIDLLQVNAGYDDHRVLRDLTMHLPAGRVLGVAGRTGSGKTTFSRLIPRLLDPQSGSIQLGGVDLRELTLTTLRGRIGIVTQEVHLFSATLRDNVTLFDSTVSDDRVREVLRDCGLDVWVASLPAGIDTIIGAERGISAGQAQLLACSRVLLQNPAVVILDEASSRLDPASERLLHEALGRLLQGRTGIIIAHRLETLAYADDLLVLADGVVVETGPRATLIADPTSHFAELLRVGTGEVIQ